MTRVLGAVLAGGQGRRFGADKALALLEGSPLIAHVIDRLREQVEAVVICGRDVAGCETLPDRPGGGLGPLAGLNAALHLGAARGFDAVLSVPCDTPFLPPDLRVLLGVGSAVLAEAPVIGLWPCRLADALDAFLAAGGSRAMWRWADQVAATPIRLPVPLANVNTPADLARLEPDDVLPIRSC